jgi:hypothetical protein
MAVAAALFASLREAADVPPISAQHALSHCRVNTSLSGKLFF